MHGESLWLIKSMGSYLLDSTVPIRWLDQMKASMLAYWRIALTMVLGFHSLRGSFLNGTVSAIWIPNSAAYPCETACTLRLVCVLGITVYCFFTLWYTCTAALFPLHEMDSLLFIWRQHCGSSMANYDGKIPGLNTTRAKLTHSDSVQSWRFSDLTRCQDSISDNPPASELK